MAEIGQVQQKAETNSTQKHGIAKEQQAEFYQREEDV
jgi:hypothetical protein